MRLISKLILVCVAGLLCLAAEGFAQRPNVVLVMTDDQGYGDLACLGNPVVKTPNLDQLYGESVRFTRFHVSPLCTPTRGALLTGRDPGRNGAYRTSAGRTMLHVGERTIANVFADEGYATGLVGKWHLGDLAPHRPQDRGFQDSVWHRCGGIGQISDYWGNDYYDDVFERNGKLERFEGYCTDVWFEEAMRFVDKNADHPFFLYIATNAPHSPYIVDEEWAAPYREANTWGKGPEFHGMVTNIDHNLGLLRKHLEERGLAENTIFVYLTDNGTANGAKFKGADSEPLLGYNGGMRGKKGSLYDGGHRVPFFIYWPQGGLTGGQDIDTLAAHIDVLPTLAELCSFALPASHEPDGLSFAPQLKDREAPPHRSELVLQFHGGLPFQHLPEAWTDSYILQGPWRLIHGKELYNVEKDPLQRSDIAADHPEVVEAMRALYVPYWDSLKDGFAPVPIDIGNPSNNPVELCCQDWFMPKGNPPWRFSMIDKLPRVTAPWELDVKKAGRYRFTLRQYPKLAEKPVVAVRAKIEIAGQTVEADVEPGSMGVVFELDLPAGITELRTYLYDDKGQAGGAYFTEVEAI